MRSADDLWCLASIQTVGQLLGCGSSIADTAVASRQQGFALADELYQCTMLSHLLVMVEPFAVPLVQESLRENPVSRSRRVIEIYRQPAIDVEPSGPFAGILAPDSKASPLVEFRMPDVMQVSPRDVVRPARARLAQFNDLKAAVLAFGAFMTNAPRYSIKPAEAIRALLFTAATASNPRIAMVALENALLAGRQAMAERN
jgi:hypothetical protein